jgi:hypothetical protein
MDDPIYGALKYGFIPDDAPGWILPIVQQQQQVREI